MGTNPTPEIARADDFKLEKDLWAENHKEFRLELDQSEKELRYRSQRPSRRMQILQKIQGHIGLDKRRSQTYLLGGLPKQYM